MRVSTGVLRRGAPIVPALAVALAVLGCHSASARPSVDPTSRASATQHQAAVNKARVKKVKVDPRMYGVHDAHLTSLTHSSTRAIRLWDTGVTWPDLQPTATGGYDWTRLDDIVKRAHANRTEVTLTLALTPSWAAASSAHTLPTDAPDLALWRAYVTAVMTRYSPQHWGYAGIANFQVWNEPNISTFWTGTPAQLAAMVKSAHDIRNAVDPTAKVIAPSMVARLAYQQKWIKSFYRLTVAGKPVWKYVDAAAFSMYPLDTYPVNPSKPSGPVRPGTPEDSMQISTQVRGLLHTDKVSASLPVWNTEVNYGMRTGTMGGHAAVPVSDHVQVAYVIRTFLLNAAQGIRRVDWYAYDMGSLNADMGGGPLGNTLLTDPSNQDAGTVTAAGKAFTRVQAWLKGGTLVGTAKKAPCIKDTHGTYTCTISYAKGSARVYWNPYGHGQVKVSSTAKHKVDEYGATSKIKGGSKLRVGFQPVLVRSAH
jgi:hypothetical protein